MKVRSRILNIVLAFFGSLVLRLLFLTVRVDHRSVEAEATPYVRPTQRKRYAFCMWHDGIAIAVFAMRTWFLSGLISQHRDGSYLADAAKLCGIKPVRGSASRGGAGAVSQLLALSEYHLAMTPDGPRGPRRTIKEGIIYIASRSGRPIVPTAISAYPAWSIDGSWTNMLLPRPFGKVLLIAGRPVEIPEGLDRKHFAEYASILQTEMDRLDKIAQRILDGDESASEEIAQRSLFPHEGSSERACRLRIAVLPGEAAESDGQNADADESDDVEGTGQLAQRRRIA